MSDQAASSSSTFIVGEKVRIKDKSSEVVRAIVACDNENGSYDVIRVTDGVELCVEVSQISHLMDFESCPAVNANDARSNGNALFKINDFEAASCQYKASLQMLLAGSSISCGSSVAVKTPQGDYETGMVAGLEDNDSGEIIFDCHGDEELDDAIVPLKQCTLLCSTTQEADLQRALYMNLARCALKLKHPGQACNWASAAVAMMKSISSNDDNIDENDNSRKQLMDAHYLKGKILLSSNRPKLAEKEAHALRTSKYFDNGFTAAKDKSVVLQKEIDQFKVRLQRENKKLARNIAEWVDVAMTSSQAAQAKEGAHVDQDSFPEAEPERESRQELEPDHSLVEESGGEAKEECIVS